MPSLRWVLNLMDKDYPLMAEYVNLFLRDYLIYFGIFVQFYRKTHYFCKNNGSSRYTNGVFKSKMIKILRPAGR